jgi:hypothetical protein
MVSIVDPSDKLFDIKVPLFVGCWVFFLVCFNFVFRSVHYGVFVYIGLMLLIPMLSMVYFEVILGGGHSAAFQLLKSHLFITIVFVLVVSKIDIIPMLCVILSLLALSIIGVKLVIYIFPELIIPLEQFGSTYGFLLLGDRHYGGNVVFEQIYFVTSPMLALPIAYYTDKVYYSGILSLNSFLALMNILGMVLAGTRTNMVTPVIIVVGLLFLHSKRKYLISLVLSSVCFIFVLFFFSELSYVFSLLESSNSTKLRLIGDYQDIFSNPIYLLFGQGFGSYYLWSAKGFNFITELTYLEIIRSYGVFLGLIMLGLIFYPIIFVLYSKRSLPFRASIVGFAVYLASASVNPLIFSSLGMTLLSAIISKIFISMGTQAHLDMGKSWVNVKSGV